MERLRVIDSHTAGEPTRVLVDSKIDLGCGSMAERRARFQSDADRYRRALLCEPRGSEIMVGAIVCQPVDPTCLAGVIFFNNVGYLGMCGHGLIGVVRTLGYLERITAGDYLIETPVGLVPVSYDGKNGVSLENVASFRHQADVLLSVPGLGEVVGDVAWGGNWFFLVKTEIAPLEPSNVAILTRITTAIRDALRRESITGSDGSEIDHIELFAAPRDPHHDSRNFVLCPGGAYDRSPCGTGTSAKIACLASDQRLAPGETWRQESVIGTMFEGSYRIVEGAILPRITGEAFVTSDATMIIEANDPLAWGISG
ncbi:proline racemase [Pirellula staleyi DSM 6068]|uniref:Proline racemase n=1 Tax=Pirellula staleyi (strain ATCC 27377 / DSM 6068 / ICPB 4128) TaxID=530564 RepID=D2QW60_PIRSD|nr:proline racemase family protein [Pirellula staleyi]ADB15935.1 proline racemase [Pirellula staleyi DSM 6068]